MERDVKSDSSSAMHRLLGASQRNWELAMKVCVPIVIVLVGNALLVWMDVNVIKATRFTQSDAVAMRRQIAVEFPPEWLRTDIREIKASLLRSEVVLGTIDTLNVRIEQIMVRQQQNSDDIDSLEEAMMYEGRLQK